MLFNSRVFLFLFLPLVYFVFWQLKNKNERYAWLTISGYVFYGYWDYRFCGLMLFSTVVSFFAAIEMDKAATPQRRKFFLVAPITVDLLLLGIFKYAGFAADSMRGIAAAFDLPLNVPAINIILPVGISFYTFHTITYIVDSYRHVIKPTRNFFEFSSYVSLFSQLVAGPIVRFRQIESSLENIDHAARRDGLDIGWSYFVIGLTEKVLIADTIAGSIDPLFAHYAEISTASAWLCALGYAYQLYFDFSGYSTMAVGLGYLFGLRLPQNFNSPYKATDISNFWERWHISLSTVLRDYLYNPVAFWVTRRRAAAGKSVSRKALATLGGFSAMVAVPTLFTMLLGGLWHGANWTFVFWGGYHGALLVAYQGTKKWYDCFPKIARQTFTFALVVFGLIFFRCETFGKAAVILHKMFSLQHGLAPTGIYGLAVVLPIAAYWAHIGPNPFEMSHDWKGWRLATVATLFVLAMVSITAGDESPFLYFQF
jgi:alginate O-acetyltransferase complex protein AlgI